MSARNVGATAHYVFVHWSTYNRKLPNVCPQHEGCCACAVFSTCAHCPNLELTTGFFFFFFGLSLPPSNMKILANFVCVWTASWVHPCTIYNIYNLFTKYLQTYFTTGSTISHGFQPSRFHVVHGSVAPIELHVTLWWRRWRWLVDEGRSLSMMSHVFVLFTDLYNQWLRFVHSITVNLKTRHSCHGHYSFLSVDINDRWLN